MCYVASSVNGGMNEDLTRDWMQGVLGKFSFTHRMLAWDSFKCHITDSIKQELAHAKMDPVIVPSGCTMDIQAPDMAWNEPFKTKVTEKCDALMAELIHLQLQRTCIAHLVVKLSSGFLRHGKLQTES